jgi:hypothetical protein
MEENKLTVKLNLKQMELGRNVQVQKSKLDPIAVEISQTTP